MTPACAALFHLARCREALGIGAKVPAARGTYLPMMRWTEGAPMGREACIGHRTVPHTADLRIEAWAPTAELCIAEAVRAMVWGFADLPMAAPP